MAFPISKLSVLRNQQNHGVGSSERIIGREQRGPPAGRWCRGGNALKGSRAPPFFPVSTRRQVGGTEMAAFLAIAFTWDPYTV